MTPQQKIVKFKELKNQRINKIMLGMNVTYPDSIVPYHLPIDGNSFITMEDKKSRLIWESIKDNILIGAAVGLHTDTCPECLTFHIKSLYRSFTLGCYLCPYGKLHGICKVRGSTWNFLTSMGIHYKFMNQFYRAIVEEINEKNS